MDIKAKLAILQKLDTKPLIAKLHEYEDALEKGMTAERDFKSKNRGFLGSGDCQKVKQLLAMLAIQAPETNDAGKKMTESAKANWLIQQRTENKELAGAIAQQDQVSFLLDDLQIKFDMTKKRLEGVRAVLALKTAQINFLTGSE